MSTSMIIALGIFLMVYFFIITDWINKTIVVLLGASLLIFAKIIPQEKAFGEVVDWNVIFLLLSMMIIVGIIKRTGLPQYIAIKAAKIAKGDPIKILIFFCMITALFSAFLGTVTTTMLIVPVSILIAVELKIAVTPFVICEAVSANVGGMATLVGDPTTIMVGSASKMNFASYMGYIDPVIGVILAVFALILFFFFRKKLIVKNERKARIMEFDESKLIEDKSLLIKSTIVTLITIAGFLLHNMIHVEPATVAILGASTLMILAGRKEVEPFFAEIEWGTIFFFIGLFIVVRGIVEVGAIKVLADHLIDFTQGNIKLTSIIIVWASGIISALVDNVPYVATMIPLIQNLGTTMGSSLGPDGMTPLWISLLLGADLGGNGTMVGATANVVAVGLAAKSGVKISFKEFTKFGAIITIINLAIASIYVMIRWF